MLAYDEFSRSESSLIETMAKLEILSIFDHENVFHSYSQLLWLSVDLDCKDLWPKSTCTDSRQKPSPVHFNGESMYTLECRVIRHIILGICTDKYDESNEEFIDNSTCSTYFASGKVA